jgi:predicted DNA-binding protein YlxM (UPF0122 family)
MDLPEARQRKNMLYDFYGTLLTEQQREIYIMHNVEDYSLAEIGVEKGITPQAVADMLKRTDKRLNSYEEHLGLVEKFESRQSVVAQIKAAVDDFEKSCASREIANKIRDLVSGID